MSTSASSNGADGASPAAAPLNGVGPNGSAPRFAVPAAWPAPGRVAPNAADETIEVGALVRTLARAWRLLLAGAVLGVGAGLVLAAVVRPWYRATASVLVRNANDPTSSLLSRFGVGGDIAGAAAGGALGGVLKSSLETEIQLLQSRELAGIVVDSLALQATVLEPRGVPARVLFAPRPVRGAFRPRTATFARQADGTYQVTSGDSTARLTPGRPGRVPGAGDVTLRAGALPAEFRVRLTDREDAVTRTAGRLSVEKLGGDVVKLRFDGPDSLTAAAVPNAAVAAYLELRRTVDRGLNARRYEFMAAQADTVAGQLAGAEDALRRQQEASGVVDPELAGKSGLDAIQAVRAEYVGLEAERQAAHALVDAVERGTLGPRQLAAFPSFLRSSGINSILQQITTLQTERTRLLGSRTERDPDVVVLTTGITDLERGLLPLARTYATSLDRQTAGLTAEQRAIEARLGALPGQAEAALRRQRDVRRLSQVLLGLQAQLIDARLAALSEGGQVRQVDVAVAPKRPVFPRLIWTLPLGLAMGLAGAAVLALARGAWSSRVRSAVDAERASGLPAVALRPGAPLLLGGRDAGTVVVVGADARSATLAVAEALAGEARARGASAAVLDARSGADGAELRASVQRAEAGHDAVYVAGPAVDDPRAPAVLDGRRASALVAAAGVTERGAVTSAAEALGRLGTPLLGVVVAPSAASATARAAR